MSELRLGPTPGVQRYEWREIQPDKGMTTLIVPKQAHASICHCPDCGFVLTPQELVVEYDERVDAKRLYADCDFCQTTLQLR